MKILTVSDEECAALWDFCDPAKLREFDLILSCGDLKADYLSFLVTMARCPVLYVHGNHDGSYDRFPPEGCDCIDGKLVIYKGLRILGLGGCKRYRPGPHQYSEREMLRRIRKLRWAIRFLGGVDIVVTHAPPEGLGDGEDIAHRGFAALRTFVEKYKPKYLIHGHVHMSYGHHIPREIDHNGTKIVNACQRYVLEVPDMDSPEKNWKHSFWQIP